MKNSMRWLLVCMLLISALPAQTASAARGVPGSPDLGYGAWLHLNGQNLEHAKSLLAELHLDWLAIEIDWSAIVPDPNSSLDTSALDRVIQDSAACGTAIMLSLTDPPAWALTPAGPDPSAAADLILNLYRRFGEQISAIELFPGANTGEGWGANPDPAAYASLFLLVQSRLADAGYSPLLIAGGLRPLSTGAPGTDWNDLDYLRGLYTAGARDWMPVLSLQFTSLTGTPLQAPAAGKNLLRHYEEVRQVMLDYGHTNGLLWMTRLAAPDGTIHLNDLQFAGRQRQAEWLQQALVQMRSQLYMGVIFAHNLNTATSNLSIHGYDALILQNGSIHPFIPVFKAIIQQSNPDAGSPLPGRPKGTPFLRCKYKT